ncbi:Alpha-ketoglutarate-dependent sulfonate dioxygenase [Alternaria alternata]|nr:Alpha-ketoglutarate-dependent sulfonate dioxygenase [Alternaria alternata]
MNSRDTPLLPQPRPFSRFTTTSPPGHSNWHMITTGYTKASRVNKDSIHYRTLTLLILKARSLTLFQSRLIRSLGLRRNPRQMPARAVIPIEQRTVRRNAIIPYHNSTRRPFNACLEVLALRDMIVQEVE